MQPIVDVQASVSGRDLGGASSDVQDIVDAVKLPPGGRIHIRGQAQSMRTSFESFGLGLVIALVLVYLLLMVLFQSALDPLVIMVAVMGAFVGIAWMLAVTATTLNVESFMGAIMAIGIAVSNSILLVSFANQSRAEDPEPVGERGRAQGGVDAPAAGADDGAGDDPGHAADGAGARARAASRTRRSGAR